MNFYKYTPPQPHEKKAQLSEHEQILFIEHLNAQLPIHLIGKVFKESNAVSISERQLNASVYTLKDFILCGDKNFEKFVGVEVKVIGTMKADSTGKNNLLNVIDIEVNHEADISTPDDEPEPIPEDVPETLNDEQTSKANIILGVGVVVGLILVFVFLSNN